ATIQRLYLLTRSIATARTVDSAKKKGFVSVVPLLDVHRKKRQRNRNDSRSWTLRGVTQLKESLERAKRHYGMGLIFASLQQTSETVISMQLLVMNLERRLRLLFCYFFKRFFGKSVQS